VERKDDVRASTLDPDDIVDRINKYVDPLIQFFRTADATAIARFRNRGSSLQSVDQHCLQMMAIIQGVAPDFDPVEVRAYISKVTHHRLARWLVGCTYSGTSSGTYIAHRG